MIYNGFILTYALFLFMELLALLIGDVAFVMVIRLLNYALITFCYYLRKMSAMVEGRRFLLYQSLIRGFVLGDSLIYLLVIFAWILFSSPSSLLLVLFVSFSLLVCLSRAFYEYGMSRTRDHVDAT